MGTATLVFSDDPNGKDVCVKHEFDPPLCFDGDEAAEPSPAQLLAIGIVENLGNMLSNQLLGEFHHGIRPQETDGSAKSTL